MAPDHFYAYDMIKKIHPIPMHHSTYAQKIGLSRRSSLFCLSNDSRFIRPTDKSAELNSFSYFSTKTYVVGTQNNRLNETDLLSTQNKCLN